MFDETQEVGVLIDHTRDDERRADGRSEQIKILLARDRAGGCGDGIAVWISFRTAEHLVDAIDEPFRHRVLERFGLVVDLGPTHAENLHEK